MKTIKRVEDMVRAAEAEVEALTPEAAAALADAGAATLVDLRDVRELEREGAVPGALHCPRGMLEFWIDPASPYHNLTFSTETTFVFFCAMGWRSALAAKSAQDMGLAPVAHIDGGFGAWRTAALPVETRSPRAAKSS